MSNIVSPKTGKLIKVGGKAYNDLLKDPKYRDTLIRPSSPEALKIKTRVQPSGLPIYSSNVKLPSLPTSPIQPRTKLPPLPKFQKSLNSPSALKKLPALPMSPNQRKIVEIYTPPSPTSSLLDVPLPALPPIPITSTPSRSLPALKIPIKSVLPPNPAKAVPTLPAVSPKSALPPLPTSPFSKSSILTSSFRNTSKLSSPSKMVPLSSLKPSSPSVNSSSPTSLKPSSPSSPSSPTRFSNLPSLSKKRDFVPTHEVYDLPEDQMEEILSMPFYDIPTLEETLKRTNRPSIRAKITKMIEEKKSMDGRGIKTRGWSGRAPTRGKERHQLKAECGDKCFLLPEEEKFPICPSPRVTGGKSKCEIDCSGVQSALIRAAQWKYLDVEAKADILLEQCKQEGLKNFLPSSPKSIKTLPSSMKAGKMDHGVIRRNTNWNESSNITLPPSLNRYGGGDKKKVSWMDKKNKEMKSEKEDCGCGN